MLVFSLVELLEDSVHVFLAQLDVDFSGFLGVGKDYLIQDQLLQDVSIQGELLELKVEELYWFTQGKLLIVYGIEELLEEGVVQNILGGETLIWVVLQELGDQVDGLGGSSGNELLEGFLLNYGLFLNHIVEEVFVANLLFLDLLRWKSHESNDGLQVFMGGTSLDQHLFVEELGDDATKGPHVYGCGIVGLVVEIELWSSVVASGHILCEVVVLVDVLGTNI